MKLLVTGATGFLGSALIGRLVDVGHKVRVLARPTSNTSELPPGVEVALGDVTALDSILAAADGVEAIIHMAALVSAWAKDPSQFDRVNVGGTENVLQVLRTVPSVKRVVYVSSFFALGPTDGFVSDGSTGHKGSAFCTDYERTKYLADCVAMRAAKEEGLGVVLVYPGVIYGPGKPTTANLLVKMIVDHFNGKLPGFIGSGTKLNCFVYSNDVVVGILAALDRGQPGKRYVLGGENASIERVFEIVKSLTGKAPPPLHIPIWVARIIGFCSVLVAQLGGPVPIFTHKSVAAFGHDWAYSSTVAAADLGYSPLDLKEGLKETLGWLKGNGYISY